MIIRARRGEYELAHTWATRFHRRFFKATLNHTNSAMPAPGFSKSHAKRLRLEESYGAGLVIRTDGPSPRVRNNSTR
jgi:hypothetical protein